MVLVLAIGDFHIPNRAPDLSEKFKALLVAGKIQHVLCTGNLLSADVEDYLRSLGPDVNIVQGDMDTSYVVQNYLSDLQAEYPSRIVANIGNIAFGLCHGHQVLPWGDERALAAMRREMGVDVMISGHTHKLCVRQGSEGGLYINPGSATGSATVFETEPSDASFVLIDVQGNKIVTYSYILQGHGNGEEVRVDRAAFDRIK